MEETITRHRLHMRRPGMHSYQATCSCTWQGEVFDAATYHSDDEAHTRAIEDGEEHWAYA